MRPPKATEQQNEVEEQHNKKGKKRIFFTIQKDIALLNIVTEQNPYQLGADRWDAALAAFKKIEPHATVKTIKDRIKKLLVQYRTETWAKSTGTVIEKTNRATLLVEIDRLDAEAETNPIVHHRGAQDQERDGIELEEVESLANPPGEEESTSSTTTTVENGLEAKQPATPSPSSSACNKNGKRPAKDDPKVQERKTADEERDKVLKAMGATGVGRAKPKQSPEEELIREKVRHEMETEKQKLTMEENQQLREYELEKKRLKVEEVRVKTEQERINLEKQREERLLAEAKKKDEMMAIMLQMLQGNRQQPQPYQNYYQATYPQAPSAFGDNPP